MLRLPLILAYRVNQGIMYFNLTFFFFFFLNTFILRNTKQKKKQQKKIQLNIFVMWSGILTFEMHVFFSAVSLKKKAQKKNAVIQFVHFFLLFVHLSIGWIEVSYFDCYDKIEHCDTLWQFFFSSLFVFQFRTKKINRTQW